MLSLTQFSSYLVSNFYCIYREKCVNLNIENETWKFIRQMSKGSIGVYKECEKIWFFDVVENIKDTLKSYGEGCLIPILERSKKLVNKAYIRKSAKEESSSVCNVFRE